jgi:hypothetical protein
MVHPNRLPFKGVLTLVDKASDKAPSGARGHRVILLREAAIEALPTLIGMAVSYKEGWDGHDARQKCGVITGAELVGKELRVAGYMYGRDFPEFNGSSYWRRTGIERLGMSFELADAGIVDMRTAIWRINRFIFTGAAILLRDQAAYKKTSFLLLPIGEELAMAASGLALKASV